MGSSLLFEVENWPGLPGTFTFERRASLLPADRVLNSAEKRLGNAVFPDGWRTEAG